MAEIANQQQASDPSLAAQEKPLEQTEQDGQIIESNWDEAVASFDDMELLEDQSPFQPLRPHGLHNSTSCIVFEEDPSRTSRICSIA